MGPEPPCAGCGGTGVDPAGRCPTCGTPRPTPPVAPAPVTGPPFRQTPTGGYPVLAYPPPLPLPRPRRTVTVPVYALLLAGLLVVLAMVATGLVTAALVRSGGSAPTDTAAGWPIAGPFASGSPSASAGSSSSASSSAAPSAAPSNPLQDPCLIGTWTETSHQQDGKIDGDNIRYTGQGAIQRFRADGTAVLDFGAGITYTGMHNRDKWEMVDVGSVTFHWQTTGGTTLYSDAHGNGTQTLKQNGKVNRTVPLTGSLPAERYTCTGDSLRQFGDTYTIELTRTSTTG